MHRGAKINGERTTPPMPEEFGLTELTVRQLANREARVKTAHGWALAACVAVGATAIPIVGILQGIEWSSTKTTIAFAGFACVGAILGLFLGLYITAAFKGFVEWRHRNSLLFQQHALYLNARSAFERYRDRIAQEALKRRSGESQ